MLEKRPGIGDYRFKQWELALYHENGTRFFRYVCPESQLWQTFFLGIGRRLLTLGRTQRNPQELTYGLWPCLPPWESTSPLAPERSRVCREESMSISLLPVEETRLFLVVWEEGRVLYAAQYQPQDGLLESIAKKVEELMQTQDLSISGMERIYYGLRVVEKPPLLMPEPGHRIAFRDLPGWTERHEAYLATKTQEVVRSLQR